MTQRMNAYEKGKRAMSTLFGMSAYLSKSRVEKQLLHLIYYRVSQINGCPYCLDMHSKDMLAEGESVQRMLVLDAWRDTPLFSNRERAALGWAEAVTKLVNNEVCDEVYEEARREFAEEELVDLTMAVNAINSYNRINIAFRGPEAGTYQPGQHAALIN